MNHCVPEESPVVEITGLELLHQSSSSICTIDDEGTYESFARDSINLRKGPPVTHLAKRRIYCRRLSNCSSLGFNDSIPADMDYGYAVPLTAMRRSSLDSIANNSNEFSNERNSSSRARASRRSLIGIISIHEKARTDYARFKSTRRFSMESYANDSTEMPRRTNARRSSMSNYAHDSFEMYRTGAVSNRRSSLDSNHSISARHSVESDDVSDDDSLGMGCCVPERNVAHSAIDEKGVVEQGMYRATRRGSLESASVTGRCFKVMRRASLSTSVVRIPCRRLSLQDGMSVSRGHQCDSVHRRLVLSQHSGKTSCRLSGYSSSANDSFVISYGHDDVVPNKQSSARRRMSNASASSAFSQEVYDSQSINTNGATRAA